MRLVQTLCRWIADFTRRTTRPAAARTDLECMRMCVEAVDATGAANRDRRKHAA